MKYLLLKLDGPMQAWGGHTYEDYRPSEIIPTRSGLIGLLAACLGIERHEADRLSDLSASVFFTVHSADRHPQAPSRRIVDFHTVTGVRKVDGSTRKDPVVSRRQYLCDTVFTIAVSHNPGGEFSLDSIAHALTKPVFTPFLGRRSCPPARPLFAGWTDAADGVEAVKAFCGGGVIYSEETVSDRALRLRDVPLYGRIRRFATRTVFVHQGGQDNVLD